MKKTKYSKSAGNVSIEADRLAADNRKRLAQQKKHLNRIRWEYERKFCCLCGENLSNCNKSFNHRGLLFVFCNRCEHLQSQKDPSRAFVDDTTFYSFDEVYQEIDDDDFHRRCRNIYKPKLDWILDNVDQINTSRSELIGRRWLELGCGLGHFISVLQKAGVDKLTGVEADENLLSRAAAKLEENVIVDWDRELTEAVSNFPADIIVAWFSIEHITNPGVFWANLGKCRQGTLLAFSVPMFGMATIFESAFDGHFTRQLDGIVHSQLYTHTSLNHALEIAGFDPVSEWIFGQDALDFKRLLNVSLTDKYSPVLMEEVDRKLNLLLDDLQSTIDRNRFADSIHVLAIRR